MSLSLLLFLRKLASVSVTHFVSLKNQLQNTCTTTMGDKGKQIGAVIVNGGSFSGANFSNPGAISGEINAPITVVSF